MSPGILAKIVGKIGFCPGIVVTKVGGIVLFTFNGNNLFCDFKVHVVVHDRRLIYRHTLQWLPSRNCIITSISSYTSHR